MYVVWSSRSNTKNTPQKWHFCRGGLTRGLGAWNKIALKCIVIMCSCGAAYNQCVAWCCTMKGFAIATGLLCGAFQWNTLRSLHWPTSVACNSASNLPKSVNFFILHALNCSFTKAMFRLHRLSSDFLGFQLKRSPRFIVLWAILGVTLIHRNCCMVWLALQWLSSLGNALVWGSSGFCYVQSHKWLFKLSVKLRKVHFDKI